MILVDIIIATAFGLLVEVAGLLAVAALIFLLAVLADFLDWPKPR